MGRKTKQERRIESMATARLTMIAGLLDWLRLRHAKNINEATQVEWERFNSDIDELVRNWHPLAELPSERPGFSFFVDAERAAEVACGWAFDAGMREAESEEAGGAAFDWMMKYRDASRALEWEVNRALAADRARIAAAIREEMDNAGPWDPTRDACARLLRVVEGG